MMGNMDTVAASLGRSVAQAYWLGSRFGGRPALFCIRHMNHCRNSCNGAAMMTAPSKTTIYIALHRLSNQTHSEVINCDRCNELPSY